MNWIVLLILTTSIWASSFSLDRVTVECGKSIICKQKTMRFKSMAGDYRSMVHLRDTLRLMASDGGYQSFTYKLEIHDSKHHLHLNFKLKPLVKEINVGLVDRNLEMNPVQLLDMKEGDFFEQQKLNHEMELVKNKLDSMGYPSSQIEYKLKEKDEKVYLTFYLTLGEPRIFKSIKPEANSFFVRDYLKKKFLALYNKPYDANTLKIYLDNAQKELFSFGYYLISFDFNPVIQENRVSVKINVINDSLFAFDLKNIKREHQDTIRDLLIDLFRRHKKPLTKALIISTLKDHYLKKSFLKASFLVDETNFINSSNESVQIYRIFFTEQSKAQVVRLSFRGNNFYSAKKLNKLFYQQAFELASLNYYDPEYLIYFQEYLRNKYIEQGYVQAKILDPVIDFNKEKTSVKVEFPIQEGQRAFIRRIEFDGVPSELENFILKSLDLSVGSPLNPIKLVDDIKKIAEILQENGYYYAEVVNAFDSNLINYNKAATSADLYFKIEAGPLVRFNRSLFLGNDKTRRRVLEKKVRLEPGEIITPSKTREIESALSATGLFNTVNVYPLKHSSKNAATDLIVKVVERDYGLIEIAPGYRTDLGLKLTGTVTYQNIGGYNRSISLRSQLNRRTSLTTIDPERHDQIKHLVEHNTTISYNQGDLFDTLIDGAASAAYQTRRFYAFDADIFRLNGTLTRDWSSRFSSSVRYQFEDISQYNATDSLNNGTFQIGALTPAVTYDLRNNQVNPTKGAHFNLSCEFANPYLLSQKNSDLTINYYKLVSRNRFYVPFKNGTIALSVVGGMQKNLATKKVSVDGVEQTEGYIPTIKVFRLTGMDIIRGFTDEEMNRLSNGSDISNNRISDLAYMANIKLEPRYFINDSLMAGVFYDAGRIFVDSVDFGELRDSVGVTFKIVTPVGTLDFDYGIKLLRKKDASGRLEDPGRFHVSIGFF